MRTIQRCEKNFKYFIFFIFSFFISCNTQKEVLKYETVVPKIVLQTKFDKLPERGDTAIVLATRIVVFKSYIYGNIDVVSFDFTGKTIDRFQVQSNFGGYPDSFIGSVVKRDDEEILVSVGRGRNVELLDISLSKRTGTREWEGQAESDGHVIVPTEKNDKFIISDRAGFRVIFESKDFWKVSKDNFSLRCCCMDGHFYSGGSQFVGIYDYNNKESKKIRIHNGIVGCYPGKIVFYADWKFWIADSDGKGVHCYSHGPGPFLPFSLGKSVVFQQCNGDKYLLFCRSGVFSFFLPAGFENSPILIGRTKKEIVAFSKDGLSIFGFDDPRIEF